MLGKAELALKPGYRLIEWLCLTYILIIVAPSFKVRGETTIDEETSLNSKTVNITDISRVSMNRKQLAEYVG